MRHHPFAFAILTAVGLTTGFTARAEGCGGTGAPCCASGTNAAGHQHSTAVPAATPGAHQHGAGATSVAPPATAPRSALPEAARPVFDGYLKIQSALARDSFQGVSATATAIAKTVRGDGQMTLSADVAAQAEALAQAKDLAAARNAFKPLSQSLIRYLADHKTGGGVYREAYCPMAKASWLQTEQTVSNPYFGQAMLRCGQFKS